MPTPQGTLALPWYYILHVVPHLVLNPTSPLQVNDKRMFGLLDVADSRGIRPSSKSDLVMLGNAVGVGVFAKMGLSVTFLSKDPKVAPPHQSVELQMESARMAWRCAEMILQATNQLPAGDINRILLLNSSNAVVGACSRGLRAAAGSFSNYCA